MMKLLISLVAIIILIFVLRVGELYTQLARYQKYWDRVNQQKVKGASLTYIAFGDSAAQGVGATSPDKGYVGLIADELSKDNKKVRTINLSKSGAKIRDVLDIQLPIYESMNLSGKTLFTVEVGANDIVTFDKNKFEKDMDELMTTMPTGTVISDIPSFKGSRLARLEYRVDEANGIIYRLAQKHHIKIANLHERVENNHGLRTFSADLFHPSDHGYRTNWLPPFLERINGS
ncbi:MAG TPA: SGNH/GDSL hydrolase family protein [Patescibacteria group bacterium]|nr:SGNH/GDSL hydrolase family protein [Patescibacteria group bacterium]